MPGDRPSLRSPTAGESAGAAPATGSAEQRAPTSTADSWTSWRNLWQVPTILLSVALIVIGVRSAMTPAMGHDFDGALTQVEQFIAEGKIEAAFAQMRGAIEPNLHQATVSQEARFHAASADLTFASQESSGQRSEANHRHIANQYAIAEELGLKFSPARIERWGETMLALGEFDEVDKRLAQLDSIASAKSKADHQVAAPSSSHSEPNVEGHADTHASGAESASAEPHGDHADTDSHGESPGQVHAAQPTAADERQAAADSYGRLFRKLIETQLHRPDLDAMRVMQMLAEYRHDTALTQAQRLWVAARLAELRLETGRAGEAIDGLLIEMRRLESDGASEHASSFGELYLLLGRGYHELGDADSAQDHLQHALTLLSPSEPARGDALVLLGRLALSAGAHDLAIEKFNIVVNEFVGTHSHLPGMLGKAECESLLGDHATSQADFREVVALLKKSPVRRDVTPAMVAQRLCDRHDAALAMGRTERALEYVAIAEPLFNPDEVPGDVLIRLASTNRQIAEDLLAAMNGGVSDDSLGQGASAAEVDPAVRYEANRRFIEAAEDYLRHASADASQPLSEADWGASLWFAADCFDRGGQHRKAIEQFERYLGSRPPDDPRKAEGMFRLAQAHEALMEFDQAALAYEALRDDRARSSFAAQCHVPLARCYLALDRVDDARRTLEEVLSGERLLQPEARDYRDALIELGRLHHQQGDHIRAIERLAEALERYPDDSRRAETQYLLADSYRCSAMEIGDRMQEDTAMAPAESSRLAALRSEQLQRAAELFGAVAAEHGPQPGRTLSASLQDLIRRAHLYQADCAFNLDQFDLAVELYESASRQHAEAASSMYALVQIVNCYAAMGDSERAAAAHQRALLRLQQLPDSAFASPDALMDRTAWERWLRNSPVGANAAGGTGTAAASAASG